MSSKVCIKDKWVEYGYNGYKVCTLLTLRLRQNQSERVYITNFMGEGPQIPLYAVLLEFTLAPLAFSNHNFAPS